MRKLHALILATGVLALVGSLALAQRGGGPFRGPSPMMLLGQESVQKELKLTPDQIEKTKAALDKQREAFQGLGNLQGEERAKKFEEMRKEADKTIAEILKPDQAKRLKQITLQQQGVRGAVANPEIAKELGITEDQKGKIQEIQEETGKQMQELAQGGFSEENRKKMQEISKAANDKVMGLLTDDQKSKWKEITGEPFKGEIRFGPPGGGPRRPPEKK